MSCPNRVRDVDFPGLGGQVPGCLRFGWLPKFRCPPDTAQLKSNIHLMGGSPRPCPR